MRTITAALVACAVALGAGTVFAKDKEDCRWIWITGSTSGGGELTAVPGEYLELMDQCYGPGFASSCQIWFGGPVKGTAKGEWVMCGNESWGIVTNPSGLPLTGMFWTNPSFLLTEHGVLCLAEQSVVGAQGDFVALEEVTGGTGIYEGMTGWLAIQKPVSPRSRRFSFAGWVCRE